MWNDEDFWPATNSGGNVSISEDDKNLYIEVAVPGIDPKDVDITVKDGEVWVQGEHKEEVKNDKRKYYRRAAQSFSYRVAVPADVDPNVDPVASIKHGMLTLTFTKQVKAQPKKIQIKSA
jgi:HSP20 family protein